MLKKLFGKKDQQSDKDKFLEAMVLFLRVEDLKDAQRIVEANPDLLSPVVDQNLASIIEMVRAESSPDVIQRFEDRRILLRRCRKIGVQEAFKEQNPQSDYQEKMAKYTELQASEEIIVTFANASTRSEKQRLIQQHPELLSQTADWALKQLAEMARARNNKNVAESIEQDRDLLSEYRNRA